VKRYWPYAPDPSYLQPPRRRASGCRRVTCRIRPRTSWRCRNAALRRHALDLGSSL